MEIEFGQTARQEDYPESPDPDTEIQMGDFLKTVFAAIVKEVSYAGSVWRVLGVGYRDEDYDSIKICLFNPDLALIDLVTPAEISDVFLSPVIWKALEDLATNGRKVK